MKLIAIDFETADHGPDSACAIGLAQVVNNKVISVEHYLIRPPRPTFYFTDIHGISWNDVVNQPRFGALWPRFRDALESADYILAHNAGFDRRVLNACCESNGIRPPKSEFVCTVKLARAAWSIRPTTLPNVCNHLGIDLNHHRADSDAVACARIAIAALEQGHELDKAILGAPRTRRAGRTHSKVTGSRPVASAPVKTVREYRPPYSATSSTRQQVQGAPTASQPTPPAEAKPNSTVRWMLILGGLALLMLWIF